MHNIKQILLFVICFYLSFYICIGYAQNDKPLRVEINAEASENYKIIPVGEIGVLIFYKIKKNKNIDKWVFAFYDSNFIHKWSKEYEITSDNVYKKYDLKNNILYLYFENLKGSAVPLKFNILIIELLNSKISVSQGQINERLNISGFKVYNNQVVLYGRILPGKGANIAQTFLTFTFIPAFTNINLLKFKSAAYIYNIKTSEIINIPLNFEGQSWAESLQIDNNSKEFVLINRNYISRKSNFLKISYFNNEGEISKTLSLTSPQISKKLSTAKLVNASDDSKILVGTYNNIYKGKKANPAFSGFNEKATGIFLSKIFNDSLLFTKFYSFSEFTEFFSNASSINDLRIKKRIIKQKQKGKEIPFNNNLLFHDVIIKDSNYIVIAEAYYPEYYTRYYTTYDYYGRPYTQSYSVFEGFRFTSALIASFNNKGDLLWSHSLRIWDILTYELNEKVKVLFDNDDIVLAYSNEGTITSIIIKDNQIIGNKDKYNIETNYPNDKLINEYNSGLEYWYGNYFISYGYQKIKNTIEAQQNKRTVFYFNKIAFR